MRVTDIYEVKACHSDPFIYLTIQEVDNPLFYSLFRQTSMGWQKISEPVTYFTRTGAEEYLRSWTHYTIRKVSRLEVLIRFGAEFGVVWY